MTKRPTDLRGRILRAASALLMRGGREAVSTRAVSAAAGVQPPAIYRQFGDMPGLLGAAAREVLAGYVRQKSKHEPAEDPIEELQHGWDVHVAFGLANPTAYALLYGELSDTDAPEARDGYARLEALVSRVAESGQLRVSVPRAARLIHAGACGVTLSLISTPPEDRDLSLSDAMREAVFAAILTATAPTAKVTNGLDRMAARAVALRAVLAETSDVLSAGERQLLGEWLDRLATDIRGVVSRNAHAQGATGPRSTHHARRSGSRE
jgi:AcrR family transcriptional regulator